MTERAKITVTEVKPVTEFGEKHTKKLTFFGTTGPEGKTLQYQCYRESLFEAVKVGAVLDIEFETKTREGTDGNTYTDRKVQQIYVNGQPVAEQKSFGGFKSFGKSPEERQSIEKQVALKEVGENLRSSIVTIPLGFVDLYWQTIERMLGMESPRQSTKTAQTPPVASPIKTEAQSEASEWPHLEKLGDLWARCNAQDITIATAQGYLGIKRGLDWNGTPDEAWTKIEAANLKPEDKA